MANLFMVVLFLLGIVTIIYPISAIGLTRRAYGVVMIIGALGIAAATGDGKAAKVSATNKSPAYQSSGKCWTDASGTYRCDHQSSFGSLGSASSSMVCRTNPVTDQQA